MVVSVELRWIVSRKKKDQLVYGWLNVSLIRISKFFFAGEYPD